MIEVDGYKRYFVTESGRVWSSKTNRYLKPQVNHKGYEVVKLVNSKSDQKTIPVHRLVAKHYLPKPSANNMQVNHKDGDKRNNHASNLEWSTCRDNVLHSWDIGLHVNDNRKGVNNRQSKLNNQAVLDIRIRLEAGEGQKTIAQDYGVDISSISLIKRNKTWQHV